MTGDELYATYRDKAPIRLSRRICGLMVQSGQYPLRGGIEQAGDYIGRSLLARHGDGVNVSNATHKQLIAIYEEWRKGNGR